MVVRLGPRPRLFSIIMVLCVERRTGFLVAERARLPLPFELPLPVDLPLPFDLRRANLRHLTFCGSIQRSYDAPYTRCEGRRDRCLPSYLKDRGLRTPTKSALRDADHGRAPPSVSICA